MTYFRKNEQFGWLVSENSTLIVACLDKIQLFKLDETPHITVYGYT